jgi:transcriptional regulator with XRE-family HTH domain
MIFYRVFGNKLRQARKAAGLTQEVLADRVGLSRPSIANIERGNQQVPLHMLDSFASVLGMKPCELLPEETRPKETRQLPKKLADKLEPLSEDRREWISRVVSSSTNPKEKPRA